MYETYEDNEKFSKIDDEFIHSIFKFHKNYENKSKNLSHFTVGVHPTYTETRCFFIVKDDETKEDFSVNKCI